ncbi:MAG: tetratricopeptide repeat protein [Bdellovibrionales bacterium]|nr:tetratricopeptide repeat protein [Bdellovibrionales bacterium]
MGNHSKSFQVKDRHGKLDQNLSEQRILSRIERGKYTGEEEVALPPYVEWQKLSSIPIFYDALMKRLFEDQYKSEDEPGTSGKKERKTLHKEEHATRRASEKELGAKTRHVEGDDNGKTQRLANDVGTRVEGTIDQALIQELFKDDRSEVEEVDEVAEQDERAAEQFIDHEDLPVGDLAAPLDVALPEANFSMPIDTKSEREASEGKKKQSSKRRILLYAVVLAGLSLLLLDSEETSPIKQPASLAPPPQRTLISDPNKLKQKVEALIWEGTQVYRQDNGRYYPRAAALFEEAIAYDAKSSQAYGGLAQSLAMSLLDGHGGRQIAEKLQDTLRKGRLIDPQSSAFYRAEALWSLQQQKLEAARELVRKAIETDPTGAENALVLGEISYAFKDLDTAKASLLEAAKSPQTAIRGNYFLGRIAFDLGDYKAARGHAQAVLKATPLHQRTQVLLGDISTKENLMQEALNHYRSAVRLSALAETRSAAEAAFKLARTYEMLGQANEAGECYLLASYYDVKVSPDIRTKIATLDNSEENIKSLLQKYVLGKRQFVIRGETYYQQKDADKTFLYIQAAHILDPNDGSILLRLGELIEENAVYYEDFLRVVSFYERAIDKDATLAKAYIKLGLLETEQYNLDRGYQLLLQAKALAPDERDTRVALGKHFYKRQDYSRALDEFLAASQIKDDDSEVLYYAGKMRLLFTRDQRQAMGFFEQSFKADPLNYDALVEWLKLKVSNFEKNFAIKLVKNLIEKDPSNPNYYWALGSVYAENKDYKKAILLYQRALDLNREDSKIRLALGRALEADGAIDKAVLEYRIASRLNRRNLEGFYRAAELLIGQKKYDEAEEVLRILIETSPKYPGAHLNLSRVYRATNKKEEALNELALEVNNNPANTKYRVEWAETLMQYQEFEKAVDQLTEIANLPAASKAPEFLYDKIRAYLLLSRCYRQLGNFESAEGAIRLALELDGSDPLLHRELGYVYVALQRNTEAAEAFEDYLKRAPAAQDAGTIKNLINRLVIPE